VPKAYRVSPRKQPGRTSYIATYYDATGKRVTRGLGVSEEALAEFKCAALTRLWVARIKHRAEAPIDTREAWALYFGDENGSAAGAVPEVPGVVNEKYSEVMAQAREFAKRFPQKFQADVIALFLEKQQTQNLLDAAGVEAAALRRDLESLRASHDQLKASIIAKTMESAGNALPIAKALEQYEKHLNAKSTKKHVDDMAGRAREFVNSLPSGVADSTKISEIASTQISEFINTKSVNGDPRYKATRYSTWRVRLGAFFNWAAKEWGYASQMNDVQDVARSSVDRERGDIQWHELAEVKAAVDTLTTRGTEMLKDKTLSADDKAHAERLKAYWPALVSTLAYAGLRLAELAWLRVEDVQLDKGQIWVTTVEDPNDPTSRHALKTARSKRAVKIHPRLLLPLLKSHMENGAGQTFLFAVPSTMRQRRRDSSPGSAERWMVDTLSTVLRGHKGGKNRPATEGILPAGMNAKSLRRTFGSLLLRSGKTTAEVAAAMGNTEEVVQKHYARIIGHEVHVDF
jgi:integrase